MSLPPPHGFISRPKAGKLYNRSQRQLERDVKEAFRTGNDKLLRHFIVVTKDGTRIEAQDTSVSQINQLTKAGQLPTWYVSQSYLGQEYGLKGSPKPEKQQRANEAHRPSNTNESKEGTTGSSYSLSDVEFFKERIRILEREKREEMERNERRETKLFEQLAVKDKQISAWDGVTQGLTKGLATGQLVTANSERGERRADPEQGTAAAVVDVTVSKTTPATKPRTKPSQSKKTARKKATQQPKWNSFPTLKKLFTQ